MNGTHTGPPLARWPNGSMLVPQPDGAVRDRNGCHRGCLQFGHVCKDKPMVLDRAGLRGPGSHTWTWR